MTGHDEGSIAQNRNSNAACADSGGELDEEQGTRGTDAAGESSWVVSRLVWACTWVVDP